MMIDDKGDDTDGVHDDGRGKFVIFYVNFFF